MSKIKPKPNYDRWKPSTKLACIIELKRLSNSPSYFNSETHKFQPITWHKIADVLNKSYSGLSKRFTNINVKDRYERVLKHHKVFVKMAESVDKFIWNPELFCFEYVDGYNNENIAEFFTREELSVVKFLLKIGHIEIEYYHRYIYKVKIDNEHDDNEVKDLVLQSPSYINEAILNGVLSISTGNNFFLEKARNYNSNNNNTLSMNNNELSNEQQQSMMQQQHRQHQSLGSIGLVSGTDELLPPAAALAVPQFQSMQTQYIPYGDQQSPLQPQLQPPLPLGVCTGATAQQQQQLSPPQHLQHLQGYQTPSSSSSQQSSQYQLAGQQFPPPMQHYQQYSQQYPQQQYSQQLQQQIPLQIPQLAQHVQPQFYYAQDGQILSASAATPSAIPVAGSHSHDQVAMTDIPLNLMETVYNSDFPANQ